MILNLKQAYLTTFYFLDMIYDENKNDVLGGLLGSMNPNIFIDNISADPAIWEDWENCAKTITKDGFLTANQAFQVMILFLEFNQNEFGDNLSWIILELKKSYENEKWIECANKVIAKDK